MHRPIGIKDVAEVAGVSITTVSHALNDKGRLTEATRQRVRRVAAELGYTPNATARNLVGGRTGLLGLAVSQVQGWSFALSDFSYFTELMSAATAAALERGYALVLAPGGPEEGPWQRIQLDGAIIVDPVVGDGLLTTFHRQGVPVVTTGRQADRPDTRRWVDNDHFAGTRSILDHLASRGAERIALVTGMPLTSYALDAESAYHEWCKEHGRKPIVAVARDNLSEGAGFAASQKLLNRAVPPDAIYGTLDRLALGALLAARSRGLRVPADLLVAGCTDTDAGRSADPPLTALALHPEQIGRAAVDMLVDLVEGAEPPSDHVLVPTRVLPRGSTKRRAHRG